MTAPTAIHRRPRPATTHTNALRLSDHPNWPDRHCAGAPLDLFHLADGEHTSSPEVLARVVHTARTYCAPCPLRQPCKQAGEGQWGIWGGHLFAGPTRPRDLLSARYIKAANKATPAPPRRRSPMRIEPGTPCLDCARPMLPRPQWNRDAERPAGYVAHRSQGRCAACHATHYRRLNTAKGSLAP